jgi:hypothetical protein
MNTAILRHVGHIVFLCAGLTCLSKAHAQSLVIKDCVKARNGPLEGTHSSTAANKSCLVRVSGTCFDRKHQLIVTNTCSTTASITVVKGRSSDRTFVPEGQSRTFTCDEAQDRCPSIEITSGSKSVSREGSRPKAVLRTTFRPSPSPTHPVADNPPNPASEKTTLVRLLHDGSEFADYFVSHLITRIALPSGATGSLAVAPALAQRGLRPGQGLRRGHKVHGGAAGFGRAPGVAMEAKERSRPLRRSQSGQSQLRVSGHRQYSPTSSDADNPPAPNIPPAAAFTAKLERAKDQCKPAKDLCYAACSPLGVLRQVGGRWEPNPEWDLCTNACGDKYGACLDGSMKSN